MEFSPFSYEMHEDPYPTYRWLRDEAPCYRNEEVGFWALSRFQDVWDATLDWETFSSSAGPSMELSGVGEEFSIIGIDPPRHTAMRNLVSRGFTPRRIAALEPSIRAIAARCLDPLVGAGRADIVAALGAKLPMEVICELVGIPGPDRDAVREWSNAFLHREPDDPKPPPSAIAASESLERYLRGLLEERRRDPRDDMMSILIESRVREGGQTQGLTDDEIVSFVNLLAAAGNETTTKLIGNAVVLLARHPDQRKGLVEEPGRLPAAIEEILRYEAPSQYQGRITLRESTWHGHTIPARVRVILITGAACRDEREFPDPDRFDIARRSARELYFGHGHHVCLGKSLARLETRVALEELLARFPDYDVVSTERVHQAHVRGYSGVTIAY